LVYFGVDFLKIHSFMSKFY